MAYHGEKKNLVWLSISRRFSSHGWFGSKVWHSNDRYRKVIYRCNRKYSDGHKCMTGHVTEEDVKQAFIKAVNGLLGNRDEIIEGIGLMQKILCDVEGLEEERIRLENEISVVREQIVNKTFLAIMADLGYDVELTYVKREG